jgi:lantibiotic biosynthesis protein
MENIISLNNPQTAALPFISDVKEARKLLAQISEALKNLNTNEAQAGLLNGYTGSALFYAYYYAFTGNRKFLGLMNDTIEKAIEALSERELLVSHCSGISGMLWGIQHLARNGFVDMDENIFQEADDILYQVMINDLGAGRYDFLHEGLGIALYFLDKLPDVNAQQYLEEAVTSLESVSVKLSTGISWQDRFTDHAKDTVNGAVYNLGLAHGVPAILSILSMIYQKGIAKERTYPLIEAGVKWLLSTKALPDKDGASLFPGMVNGGRNVIGEKQSRLGWCYGDLGVAITILNVGLRLNNSTYIEEAMMIFIHVMVHRDITNGMIRDASLCHGTIGVAQIFRRAWFATGERMLCTAAQYWFHETIKMSNREDSAGGFKYATPSGYQTRYFLLEGITGIGLGLIANLDNNILPGWDRCLLIS